MQQSSASKSQNPAESLISPASEGKGKPSESGSKSKNLNTLKLSSKVSQTQKNNRKQEAGGPFERAKDIVRDNNQPQRISLDLKGTKQSEKHVICTNLGQMKVNSSVKLPQQFPDDFKSLQGNLIVDKKTNILYSWTPLLQNQSSEETKGQIDEGKLAKLSINQKFKVVDLAFSSSKTNPICFVVNEKGEVFYSSNNKSKQKEDRIFAQQDPNVQESESEPLHEKALHLLEQVDNFVHLSQQIQSTFISAVACGLNHALLLTSSGFVYAVGDNQYGQLGKPNEEIEQIDGSYKMQTYFDEPSIVFGLLNLRVVQVFCGDNHSLVMAKSRENTGKMSQFGSVDEQKQTMVSAYVWGSNKNEQLNLPDLVDQIEAPQLIQITEDALINNVLSGPDFIGIISEDQTHLRLLGSQFKNLQQPIMINQGSPVIHDALKKQIYLQESGKFIQISSQNGNKEVLEEISAQLEPLLEDKKSKEHLKIEHNGSSLVYMFLQNCTNEESRSQIQDSVKSRLSVANENSVHSHYQASESSIKSRQDSKKVQSKNEGFYPQEFSTASQIEASRASANTQSILSQVASGIYRSVSRSSVASSSRKSDTNLLSFDQQLQQEYVFQGGAANSEMSSLFEYIALTGNAQNIGLTEEQFLEMKQKKQETGMFDERDRLQGEDMIDFLKRKREKQKVIEKNRTNWLKKQQLLEGQKKVWEHEIFPNWDNVWQTKKVRDLWIQGMPRSLRGKVWFLAFGNRGAITRDLFNIMAERGHKLRSLLKQNTECEQQIIDLGGQVPDKQDLKAPELPKYDPNNQFESEAQFRKKLNELEPLYPILFKLRKKLQILIGIESGGLSKSNMTRYIAREKSISIIDTDVPRTFPKIAGLFQPGGVHHLKLHRILEAFTMYRPDIGYVQGMSYVAATLLLFMDSEYQSFVTFCNLMTKYPIMPFYSFNDVMVRKIMQLYKQVFAYNLPELCEHFELENVQPKHYIYEWFMTLFTRAFDLRLVTRVWDFYFLDGIKVLFQTAITILRMLEYKMLEGEMDEILPILQHVSEHITADDEEEFVKTIYEVKFPEWVHQEIPLLESEFFKQDIFD